MQRTGQPLIKVVFAADADTISFLQLLQRNVGRPELRRTIECFPGLRLHTSSRYETSMAHVSPEPKLPAPAVFRVSIQQIPELQNERGIGRGPSCEFFSMVS